MGLPVIVDFGEIGFGFGVDLTAFGNEDFIPEFFSSLEGPELFVVHEVKRQASSRPEIGFRKCLSNLKSFWDVCLWMEPMFQA